MYVDDNMRTSRRTNQDANDTNETGASDWNTHKLEAEPDELDASEAIIPTAYDNSSVKSSVGEDVPRKVNDPKSVTRSRKRLKTFATKVETAKASRVNKQNPESLAKQTTTKERSKADVEVQAKNHRSKTSPQKRKVEETTIKKEEETIEGKDHPKKSKRKRKTKEEKEAEAMPLAARSTGLQMFVGAHVSSAKGRSLISSTSYSVYVA